MGIVSKEVAAAEVAKWLDLMQISQEKRSQLYISVARLTEAVEESLVIVNDDLTLTQNLKFPFGGLNADGTTSLDLKITKLNFKSAITVGQVQKNMIGTREDDQYASAIAHISAATGELKQVIQGMNTKDYKVSDAIAVFFML